MCYAALFYDQQSHTSTIHGCCHGNSVIFDLYFLWIIQNTIPHVLLLVSMSQLRPTTRLTTATMSANAVSRDMPGSASWPIGKTPFLIVKSRRQTRYLWGTKRSTIVYSALGRLGSSPGFNIPILAANSQWKWLVAVHKVFPVGLTQVLKVCNNGIIYFLNFDVALLTWNCDVMHCLLWGAKL